MSELTYGIQLPPARNLTHGLLDALGRMIVTGAFADTPFPTEAEMAGKFAVSRSVIREAVKMLGAKGLLSSRPRQGTSIRPESAWNLFDPDVLRWLMERKFSLRLLRQFNELRLAIEPQAAQLAARNAGAGAVDRIRAGFDRMAAAEAGLDDPLDADIAFHVAVLAATGNPFYAQFHDLVATALRTSIRFTNRFKGHSASLPDHKAVLDAIVDRDAARAHQAMDRLIRDVLDLIGTAGADETLG